MDTSDHVLWLLKRAFHYGRRAVDEAIRAHGVTTAQIGLMNRLIDEPGLSGAELARRLLITPQAAQLALTTLERRGLVERKPDPNHGRIIRTFLTEEGRRVTDVCLADAVKGEEKLLEVFDAEERRMFRILLLRLMDEVPEDDDEGDDDL